ncbi:endoplasmic reticulum Golgi intermediate [Trichuris trichiura]|uniref:Endoplasmic reticulum Golgi intermediate n=1 Tax=Trichuris trichiura TaxID=36087 RepID=A0A077ZFG0_TRITR|nr:endoplasmic reticulum Golgi intermediate [Trichuris trichiura]
MNELRRRKPEPVLDFIESLDAFPKVNEDVKEKPSPFHGVVFVCSWCLIIWLVYSELQFYRELINDYRFFIDIDYDEKVPINIDLTVAMPCSAISVDFKDVKEHILDDHEGFKLEPVRFELLPESRKFWNVLREINVNRLLSTMIMFKLLLVFNSDEEIWRSMHDMRLVMNSAGASHGRKDGCRIYGQFLVAKVHGSFHVTFGRQIRLSESIKLRLINFDASLNFNFSHRIEKLAFGPRLPGAVNPLDGVERTSMNENDLFQYYVNVVPTKMTKANGEVLRSSQYSVTQLTRTISHSNGSHGRPGISIIYELSPILVDITQRKQSIIVLLLRLCAIIGGVFATSDVLVTFSDALLGRNGNVGKMHLPTVI